LSSSTLSPEFQEKVKKEYVAENKSKLLEGARVHLNKKYDEILSLLVAQDDEIIGNLAGFFSKLNNELEIAEKNKDQNYETYFNLLISKHLIPNFESEYKNIVRFSIERRMVFLSMAIRTFYEKQNFFPDTFSQIGSNLEIFTDLFSASGEDFKIKQEKESLLIYSNGFNLYDDKGSCLLDIVVSIRKSLFKIKSKE